MIEIVDLKKNYNDVNVLKNINLKIDKGDIFGLVGLSGAGKSTLLRCISGLDDFIVGKITINGIDVKDSIGKNNSELRKKTGMIFQQFSLLNRLTVYENVALPMKCWKYSKDQIDKRVRELIKLVGLEDKLEAKPRHLSGGQKQRVAIARALTMNPSVLFCDEATSSLDPITTSSILDLLRSINSTLGVTIVVVTHEMSVVKSICNKMAILNKGEIIDVGNVDDIFLQGRKSLRFVVGEQVNGASNLYHSDCIKIIFRNKKENELLLSKLSKETDIAYTVAWSSFDTYRGEVKGYYIIKFNIKDKNDLITYLRKEQVEFMEVDDHDE
ncbi:MAG: ATP-binding cassette domain-containing protein [Tissierellia bacterium]|nr:ATP-binding cassette domain-containing protein [Tissierellia bacterium]